LLRFASLELALVLGFDSPQLHERRRSERWLDNWSRQLRTTTTQIAGLVDPPTKSRAPSKTFVIETSD